jgi:hypothetical protein
MVVYRHQRDVQAALRQLRQWLPIVVVVDNGATAHPELQALCRTIDVHYLHGANAGALAGAYNQALSLLRGLATPPETVLFLDEDSDIGALPAFLDDADTRRTLVQPDTAAISPAYRDRATGLRGRYMWLRRFKLGFNPREFDGVREVAFVINSMSVWRMPALQRIVQAAGRVLRSPEDRGYLWLLDDRYRRADVVALLPPWWQLGHRA